MNSIWKKPTACLKLKMLVWFKELCFNPCLMKNPFLFACMSKLLPKSIWRSEKWGHNDPPPRWADINVDYRIF